MFEQLLMSLATEPVEATITSIITEIAVLVGAIGGLLAVVLPRIKTTDERAKKALEIGISGAQAATFAARGVVENREKIQQGIGLGLKLAPDELQKYAEDHKEDIRTAARELEIKRKQLEALLELVPKEGQIDLVKDFPR